MAKYNCGISLNDGTAKELAQTILRVYEMPRWQYVEMSANARLAAADFDYKKLTEKLLAVIDIVKRNPK